MPQTALITGITGQDGAYLAEFLLNKGYIVHGIQRRTSGPNTARIHNILNDIHLHYGDMTDGLNITKIIHDTKPDEIYNLAAQSDVAVSFDTPEYTANTDALGPLRLLEAIRILNPQIRFYQASSSELFGNASSSMQDENTPFQPQSPYACAKLYAYWTVVNYRDAYGLHASNGICFNHESPLRGEEFVTQKICAHIAAMEQELTEPLRLGNLNAKRDWGHAQDYVRGMWMMMQAENPDDYVLATGQTRTVREFVEHAFKYVGKNIQWQGTGINEQGMDAKTGQPLVTVDPNFYRPNEVHTLCGHAKKIEQDLGWQPEIPFEDLLVDMMRSALRNS
jgi:GDPmannose 4,6-dehydratase